MRAGRGKASRPLSQDRKAALGLAAAQRHPIVCVCGITGVHHAAAPVDGGWGRWDVVGCHSYTPHLSLLQDVLWPCQLLR